MLGIEQLLGFQGAEAYCSEPKRRLLRFVQQIPIWASLAVGQASIMARPEWRKVPWAGEAEGKPADQYLFEILADATILYRDRNSIINSDCPNFGMHPQFDSTLARASATLEGLRVWHDAWNRDHPGDCIKLPLENALQEQSVRWPYDLSFSNQAAVKSITLFNAVRIVVLGAVRPLLTCGAVHIVVDPSQPNAGIEMEHSHCTSAIQACAIRICRCAEYCLTHHRPIMGNFFIQSAMHLAWIALGKSSTAEGRWLESIFEETKRIPFTSATQVIARTAFETGDSGNSIL